MTAEQLKQISPGTPLDRCKTFADQINHFCPQYGIDTPVELASFLSQILHETGGLKWLKELWGPTKQQLRYERDFSKPWPCKKGDPNWLAYVLGNDERGDGKKYFGRGLIHVTGKTNYLGISKAMFNDDRLLGNPDILATPQYAVLSACIYWHTRKLDKVDDDLKILDETKGVNGGFNGLVDRQQYFDRALVAFKQ